MLWYFTAYCPAKEIATCEWLLVDFCVYASDDQLIVNKNTFKLVGSNDGEEPLLQAIHINATPGIIMNK